MSILANYRSNQKDKRALRRPSELEFAIADGIDYVNPAHWDAVTRDAGFFFERSYLRVLESAGPENLTPRYALIYRNGTPVAVLNMQLVRIEAARMRKEPAALQQAASRNPAKRLMRHLGKPAAATLGERVRQRVLVCGNLLSYGFHAAAFAAGTPPETVWPAIAEVLYRVRRAEKLSGQTNFVLIKDLTAPELKSSRILEKFSFHAVQTEPNMMLELNPAWKNHEGYLAGMASKYRSAVKNQILKPIEEAGCTLVVVKDVGAVAARLQALYLEVHQNAGLRPVTLPEAYWPALAAAAGNRLRVIALMQGDAMLGFIGCLKDGNTGVAYHIGFDRAASAGLPIYLRLLHAAIEHLIAMGAARVSLGRTALEPKARLGAKPQPMSVWMRHQQPLINQVTRRLLGFAQHDEAPEVSPFKKEKEKVA
ncbi:MAG TPA: GNAT family N-acetyltransferase [Burkholderiales bacterium]|jgi:predicted N-acyltransferase|nr:GNAT family N-acetyltransferase [Burkholderiales bacterium]